MGKRDPCDWCIPAHSRDECEWRRTASYEQPERADRYHAKVLQNSSHSSVCLHFLLDTCSTSREHCIPLLVDRWPAAAWRRNGLRSCGIPTMYIAAANSRKCRMRQLAELIKPAESQVRDQSPDAPDLGSRRVRCALQKKRAGESIWAAKAPTKRSVVFEQQTGTCETMKLRHTVYGSPVGIVTYLVAILASMGGFIFGWYVSCLKGWLLTLMQGHGSNCGSYAHGRLHDPLCGLPP